MPFAAKTILVALGTLILIATAVVHATHAYFFDVLAIGAFPAVLAGLAAGKLERRWRRGKPHLARAVVVRASA